MTQIISVVTALKYHQASNPWVIFARLLKPENGYYINILIFCCQCFCQVGYDGLEHCGMVIFLVDCDYKYFVWHFVYAGLLLGLFSNNQVTAIMRVCWENSGLKKAPLLCYTVTMIKSFSDEELEQCWRHGKCRGICADLKRRILMKLDSMDAAINLEDLRNPPSNRLHQLKGIYQGTWAISVNDPWRLIFCFENSDIYDVALVQY